MSIHLCKRVQACTQVTIIEEPKEADLALPDERHLFFEKKGRVPTADAEGCERVRPEQNSNGLPIWHCRHFFWLVGVAPATLFFSKNKCEGRRKKGRKRHMPTADADGCEEAK